MGSPSEAVGTAGREAVVGWLSGRNTSLVNLHAVNIPSTVNFKLSMWPLLVWELKNGAFRVPGKLTSHKWASLVRSVYESLVTLELPAISKRNGHILASGQELNTAVNTGKDQWMLRRGSRAGGSCLIALALRR